MLKIFWTILGHSGHSDKATSSTNSAQCSAINSKVQIAHVSRGYVKYGNSMRKRETVC